MDEAIDPRTVQPVASRYTDRATRPVSKFKWKFQISSAILSFVRAGWRRSDLNRPATFPQTCLIMQFLPHRINRLTDKLNIIR
jgi:hypothetical protein